MAEMKLAREHEGQHYRAAPHLAIKADSFVRNVRRGTEFMPTGMIELGWPGQANRAERLLQPDFRRLGFSASAKSPADGSNIESSEESEARNHERRDAPLQGNCDQSPRQPNFAPERFRQFGLLSL
jgi:hypothetical protein